MKTERLSTLDKRSAAIHEASHLVRRYRGPSAAPLWRLLAHADRAPLARRSELSPSCLFRPTSALEGLRAGEVGSRASRSLAEVESRVTDCQLMPNDPLGIGGQFSPMKGQYNANR
jgi:hypothetical protein